MVGGLIAGPMSLMVPRAMADHDFTPCPHDDARCRMMCALEVKGCIEREEEAV